MSEYQAALAAARRIKDGLDDNELHLDSPRHFREDAETVARMLLRNHAIAHGEKPDVAR